MRREFHVRFCEGGGVRLPSATRLVVGFEDRTDAERFWKELRERFAQFGLELHPEKTRLVEFGRYAAGDRASQGRGKPETFDFLGFTHLCGKTREGWFQLWRRTERRRLRAKLQEVKAELRRRWHHPIPEVGRWLGSVVDGHGRYYGVPYNQRALEAFRREVTWLWRQALMRRSQRAYVTWSRMRRLREQYLPPVRLHHPYPDQRFRVRTQGRSPVR